MYKEKFEPLTKKQIKLINHTGLGEAFKCSHTYVSRVLKSTEEPKAPKAKAILKTARQLIAEIEEAAVVESKRLEAKKN